MSKLFWTVFMNGRNARDVEQIVRLRGLRRWRVHGGWAGRDCVSFFRVTFFSGAFFARAFFVFRGDDRGVGGHGGEITQSHEKGVRFGHDYFELPGAAEECVGLALRIKALNVRAKFFAPGLEFLVDSARMASRFSRRHRRNTRWRGACRWVSSRRGCRCRW